MKREALNSSESSINNDILFPLVDNMLEQRKQGCDRINKLYGTNISVKLNSSWSDNHKEEQAVIDSLEKNEETADPTKTTPTDIKEEIKNE